MKKLFLILTTILILPSAGFAAGGACSSHGGVNCAAGADTDGSVICMDGWEDSSVDYINHEECHLPYVPQDGDLVKSANSTAVYYVKNIYRYSFPFFKIYEIYFNDDFSMVKTIKPDELASLMLNGNILLPANTLVKITSDPKVYKVNDNYNLEWVETEEDAITGFGADWATKVIDVPDVFFIDYQMPETRSIPIL